MCHWRRERPRRGRRLRPGRPRRPRPHNRGATNFKGLLRGRDYTPKLSYCTYQCLCALFDAGAKRRADVKPALAGPEAAKVWAAGFARGERALLAWWRPGDLLKPAAPGKCTIALAAPTDAGLGDPVLVDPLTAKAYKLPTTCRPDGTLALADAPVLDYPLIVTDRSVALAEEAGAVAASRG